MSTIADANVNPRRGRKLVVHIMFLFFFYCVRPSSSFASPSSIRRLGLGPHGQITYCMPGDEQNEYTLK
jgi:hypothetical protein